MGIIFIVSAIPMDGGDFNIDFLTALDPAVQNLLHIPVYGTLAFLWLNFFWNSKIRAAKAICFSLLITIGYGGLDEIHQMFVSGRYAGFSDIFRNTFGACLGTLLFFGFRKKPAAQ